MSNMHKIAARAFAPGCLAALMMAVTALSIPAKAQTAPPLEKIVVATQLRVTDAALFFAKEEGYFKDEGLDVEFQFFDAPDTSVLAVASGSADFGTAPVSASVFNIAGKGGIRVIAGGGMEEKGFQGVGFLATNAAFAAGLTSVKDFKGKRVGLTTIGGPVHYDLGVIAKKYGYSLGDMTLVPMQTIPNEVAAFKGGQLDAMCASTPTPGQLEAAHAGHVIGWFGDISEKQTDAVLVRPSLIKDQRGKIEKFLRAYVRGLADYNAAFNQLDAAGKPIQGPHYDELLQVMAKTLNVAQAQLVSQITYEDPQGRLLVWDIQNQIDFWKGLKQIDPSLQISQVVDPSFIKGNFMRPN